MELCLEASLVSAGLFPLVQLVLHKLREKLLGLDQGNLDIAVRVSLKEQLLLNGLRKDVKYLVGRCRKTLADEFLLSSPVRKCIELLGL